MPGGSKSALAKVALDEQMSQVKANRAIEDAHLERIGATALARAKMQDMAEAEAQAAADAENKAQMDEQSGYGEREDSTEALAGLFTPVNAQSPRVNELNPGSLMTIPRGAQGGGPQPYAGGGGPGVEESAPQVGGGADPYAYPDTLTSYESETKPVETFPGVYAPMTTQRARTEQNALTAAQAARLRLSAGAQAEKQRVERMKLLADTDQGTFDTIVGSLKESNPRLADELSLYREQNQRQRRLKGTVTYYDPTSPTGGKTIPISDMPPGGVPAVPRRVNPDSITLNAGKPTATIQTQLQESLATDLLDFQGLNTILNSFRPEFLQVIPQGQFGLSGFLRRMGASAEVADRAAALSPGDRQAFTAFQNFVMLRLNDYIQKKGGAVVPPSELERFLAAQPNLQQDPDAFITSVNTTLTTLRLRIAANAYLLRNGFGDPAINDLLSKSEMTRTEALNAIPTETVRSAMENRLLYYKSNLVGVHPDWSEQRVYQEARDLMLKDFNLMEK